MEKKIALITGASRGIGRAVALALAQAGSHVLINFRSRQADAAETLALVERAGGTGELCPFDVADAAACTEALARHPRIDILVNNAGIRQDALLVFMKPEQWNEVIATNLSSFYNVTQPVVKQMAMNRWGRIVTIASTAGQTGMPGQVNYAAAKAGVIGASKALAKEVAKRGVTVNVLAPGFIETEMTGDVPREQVLPLIPAGRFGKPEEVAAAAVFLCSDSAAYITGAVLNINGGTYTNSGQHWSGTGQLRGTPAGIRFFILVVRWLGLGFAYACAVPTAIYFSFASPDVRATIDFHRRVMGPQPWWKRRWLVAKHYYSFGQMIIDRFAILSGNLHAFTFSFDGEQHLLDALAEGRGLVLINAHLGNWEAAGQLLHRANVLVNIAGHKRETAAVRSLLEAGEQTRFRYITLDGSPTDVLPMLAVLRRGEILALLGDRSYGSPIARVPFFGEPAAFPVGPYLVAALAGAPLVQVFGVRESGRHYRFIGFPAEHLTAPAHSERDAFLKACVTRYAARLEKLVRQYPLQWYNFYPFWNAPPP